MKKLKQGECVKVGDTAKVIGNSGKSPSGKHYFYIGDTVTCVHEVISGKARFEKDGEKWWINEDDFELLNMNYVVGKSYEFSDDKECWHNLPLYLEVEDEFRFLVNHGGGDFSGFKYIREIENPRIKEIESQMEELQKELKTLTK